MFYKIGFTLVEADPSSEGNKINFQYMNRPRDGLKYNIII